MTDTPVSRIEAAPPSLAGSLLRSASRILAPLVRRFARLKVVVEHITTHEAAAFVERASEYVGATITAHHLLIIGRGLMIAASASTVFARLAAGAITLTFFTYAFVNMGMVSGILPVVGVPLPFISYGGTAMVTLGLGLGILMSIAKSKRLVQS